MPLETSGARGHVTFGGIIAFPSARQRMQARRASVFLIAALCACSTAIAGGAEPRQPQHEAAPVKAKKKARAVERPFGREGDPKKVKRVIRIDMSDTMRYFPAELRVKRGDTVRFVLNNKGELPHVMVIGSMEELQKRAALAKKNGDLSEAAADGVLVAPGTSAPLVWQFTRAGEFYYGCLAPGHFDAGMIGTIVVR
jgi:uncharacterized cupredoxin-like copper-binding protein